MQISWWRVSIGLFGALALCLHAARNPRDPQLFQIFEDPAAFVGKTVQLYVESRIEKITPEGFVLRQSDSTITVLGEFSDLIPGNQVSVKGVFQSDGTLRGDEVSSADPTPREFRKWISVLGLMIIGVALVRNLRLSRLGLEMRADA